MKQAYAPALEVSENTLVEKTRELPLKGVAQVEVGDLVQDSTIVLTAELPGDLSVIRVAERMGFEPEDVAEKLLVKEGDTITKGQLLCEIKTFFGMFTSQFVSPTEGVVEFFTSRNAHLGIRHESKPISVDSYINGQVVGIEEGKRVIIRANGALLQGVFGVGGERRGRIEVLDIGNDIVVTKAALQRTDIKLQGAVLVGGSQFSFEAISFAAESGVEGIVTGSIDAAVLSQYVGHEIGVSITGDEDIPTTLIVTEGFGKLPISDRVIDLARKLQAKTASINGATQVRAGATRPEVIVTNAEAVQAQAEIEPKTLNPGAAIRIIRVPYFGCFGKILELPSALHTIESGAHVRVLKAALDDGREVIVPRANVELL